ncbi:MAG: hypothetical protein ABI885_05490, partial [Gammaproteobacteria bacterium]
TIAGRANTIHLQAGSVACIDRIMVKDLSGKELQVDWQSVKANEVEINLPLQQFEPGSMTLLVSQYGSAEPQLVELRAVAVSAPRPSVDLLAKSVQSAARSNGNNIRLASEHQLPQDAQLVFSVRAKSPATFARDESIEIATEDEAFATALTLANRGLTLANARVAVATFDPAKAFGFSAFGPLKFRVVLAGVPGDWQALATLVRLPELQALQCPASPEKACKLTGANLFLVDSVSGDREFKESVQVPEGFPGRALPVPHPGKGGLYLKLRDDPSVINSATLLAEKLPSPPPANDEAPAAPPPAAALAAPTN